MNRLTGRSTYADARESFIKEVTSNSKYGEGSPEHKAVVNAWYAVGVGNKYVEKPQNSYLKPGKYVIVANREEDSKNNWYYMTSDLGTASTKRFQAVSTGKENIDAIKYFTENGGKFAFCTGRPTGYFQDPLPTSYWYTGYPVFGQATEIRHSTAGHPRPAGSAPPSAHSRGFRC